jgi:two-component system NtrC family response regulator
MITVDVRMLAATNRDLKAEVRACRFREDLYFRLNVVQIDVPSLRDRVEDIPLLAERYLQHLVQEGGTRGRRFAPGVLTLLSRYSWPGNVRELQNAVAHAALMAQAEEIQPEDFPVEVAATGEWVTALDRVLPPAAQLGPTLKAIERHLIERALAKTQGVQAKAADLLGISRSLLQYKLKNLDSPADPASDPGPVQKT